MRNDDGVRVLVVEDEPLIAKGLQYALEAESYVVDVANRGDDGLWMATENTYDAIILDVMLPGMNGFVVCRELRAKGCTTPIMMLTAKDGDSIRPKVLTPEPTITSPNPFHSWCCLPTFEPWCAGAQPLVNPCYRRATCCSMLPRERVIAAT